MTMTVEPSFSTTKPSSRITAGFQRFMLLFTILYIVPNSQTYFASYVPFLRHTILPLVGRLQKKIWGPKYQFQLTPDSHFYYAYFFSTMLVSSVIALLWTVVRPRAHERIFWWWSNLLRICLAGLLFFYGIFKVIPVQMPEPSEVQLMLRLNDFTPMDYLYIMVGFSPAYQMITGWIEVIGAIFLLIPRLIILGGLINLIVMFQVAILNYCYDWPVKLLSTWMFLGEFILLFSFLKNSVLYLLGKIAMPRLEKKRIITVRSRFLRSGFIIIYCLGSIFIIVRSSIYFWDEYKIISAPRPPITGVWIIQSITSVIGDNEVYTKLHVRDWEILAISPTKYPGQILLSTYIRTEQAESWTMVYHAKQHDMYLDDPQNHEKITMHFEIAPVLSQKLSTHSTELNATFTIYDHKSIQPIFVIHTQRYVVPRHHPGEFHWMQENDPVH